MVEDYSDMASGESELGLSEKLAQLKLRNKSRRGLMHPDDLRRLKSLAPIPASPQRSLSTPTRPVAALASPSTPNLAPPGSPRPPTRSPPGSRSNSLRTKADLSDTHPELMKFAEKGDEDYSDMFEGALSSTALGKLITTSGRRQLRLRQSYKHSDPSTDQAV